MDLKLFSDMLKDLLSANDSVALGGLCRFMVEDVAASFSDRGFTINPPYRKIVFKSDGGGTDTLLADFYASSNPDVNPDEARKALADFVAQLRQRLFSEETVTLPGLGRMRATRGNVVIFIQDENLNLFPQYDWLEPVSMRSRYAPEPVSRRRSSPAPGGQYPGSARKRTGRIFLIIFVIVIVLVALFFATLSVLGRYCPEIVDPLLYTPEQLEILNFNL